MLKVAKEHESPILLKIKKLTTHCSHQVPKLAHPLASLPSTLYVSSDFTRLSTLPHPPDCSILVFILSLTLCSSLFAILLVPVIKEV